MMKRIDAALDRADGALRAWLMGGRIPGWLLELLTFAAFFALMMTRTLTQLAGASMGCRMLTVFVLCLPLAVMLRFAGRIARAHDGGALMRLAAYALCATAMLARVSFIERSRGDYDIYLDNWIDKLAAGSFSAGMRANVGEYNVLYQYILFLITRLPVPPLYAVKAVSFIGDAFLAGACARLAARDGKDSIAAFAAILLLPSIALNGGMFTQCDSLYAACALWGLALCIGHKPMRAAACFALSFAFKLQSAFILPMVAVLWANRRFKLRDAFVFLLTLIAVALPALAGGKTIGDILSIYTAQTGLYTGLTYNAASFFGLMDTTGLDVYAYGNFGMAMAFGACAVIVYLGVRSGENTTDDRYVQLALLMVLLVVFLLPRMHERYFYMAGALSVAFAARRGGKSVFAAALIELAMMATCWALAVTLPMASMMMLAAAAIILAC